MYSQVFYTFLVADDKCFFICCRIINKERQVGKSYITGFGIKVKMLAQCSFYSGIIFNLFCVLLRCNGFEVRIYV